MKRADGDGDNEMGVYRLEILLIVPILSAISINLSIRANDYSITPMGTFEQMIAELDT